jgi:hypothetical protein
VLQKYRNNRLRAAAELGISRMTLYKKLHRYGLMCCGPATWPCWPSTSVSGGGRVGLGLVVDDHTYEPVLPTWVAT